MRKDLKLVVAVASLLLVGLLSYVLFAPSHKKGAVLDETTATDSSGNTTSTSAIPTQPPAIAAAPATQPAVTVSLTPATQPVVVSGPVVPSVDSNVAVAGGPTDWDKTLNTGSVSTSSGSHLPTNTLIAATDTTPMISSSAGPSTRPSSLAMAGSKTHKVVSGETLSSIAAEVYGNRANYTKIVAANPGINPNRLKVGTILNIPDLSSSTSTEKPELGMTSANSYTVKPGDSLQRIATKLYGSSDKWEKIYELNRASIGGDPHRLKAGAVLKLPEAPKAASTATH
ncbi:MAG TPA: LysM domain-containing protein [Tepidisphaeraceae bacterium]|jgi:nucleoid-associated protein YgaU|nr:LysM domain-containing protein [Tepidisphaeraceae bacterium]